MFCYQLNRARQVQGLTIEKYLPPLSGKQTSVKFVALANQEDEIAKNFTAPTGKSIVYVLDDSGGISNTVPNS
jgi:hypothetical protein